MGIRGLTHFVHSTKNLWTTIDLQDTKLVIDGLALNCCLFENSGLDYRCGGQYDEFYQAVVAFFVALKSSHVHCFVVFDGAIDPSGKKLETIKKRAEEGLETVHELSTSGDIDSLVSFPLLFTDVFKQALRDNGIPFAICDSEADSEIASLAAAWKCPVLSNDSDFFIFDIKGGYIPLSFLRWNSSRFTAKIYYRSKLASHFRIRSNLLPLFASLAGNDYVSANALVDFKSALARIQNDKCVGKRVTRFAKIVGFLRGLPSLCSQEEALKFTLELITSQQSRNTLQHVIELSLQEYKIKESNLLRYFEEGLIHSSLRTLHGKQEIEKWVLPHFRAGKFSIESMNSLTSGRNFLGIQIENFEEISSNCCSLDLRKFVYGILSDVGTDDGQRNITTVEEYDRQGFKFTASNVEPNIGDSVPGLSLIPFLEPEERYNMLLFALDTNTSDVSSLPENAILIASSVRYLINHAEPAVNMNHLKALLCCWVLLKNPLTKSKSGERRPTKSSSTFCLHAAHSFCQWQCVVRDAIMLNYTLLEPVPSPHIHEVFSGTLAQSLHGELQKGCSVEELRLLSSSDLQSYDKLYTAVTKNFCNKIATQ
ncbi:protein asteroid homolog 1-like [Acropora millepora]|uniref:protein asteroid homolog 1-like n=1 Tax=Acropora millepora TaxID=45264 RepID=UPI001CF51F81|nr:protein asteroid homolog 1-like [Acropora millepora]